MAMASGLHERRKHVTDHWSRTGSHDLPPLSGGPYTKGKDRRFISNELKYALLAVVAFLTLGLFLGYVLLHHQHRKVVLHIMKHPWTHGGAILRGRAGFRHHFYTGPARFVTVVMPSVVDATNREKRLQAIQDTWGPYARAIYVVHNVTEFPAASHAVIGFTEDSKPEDEYSFPQLLLLPSDISFEEGVPRLLYTLRTIYQMVNPDFAFFVNDHTYVLPEHLCKFLEYRHADEDLYAGHALRNGQSTVFNSGAAGYILSRSTMKKIIDKIEQKDPNCFDTSGEMAGWLQENPGLVTVKCLDSLGVKAIDTRSNGEHRFHAFPLVRVVAGKSDQWYENKHESMSELTGFDSSYDHLVAGEQCCAKDTVSFHYVGSMEARALFATREALLINPRMTDHELKTLMTAEWPKDKHDVGGYSRPLPTDDAEWLELMKVLRKISTRETQVDC